MLNFQAVHDKEITLAGWVAGLTRDDLRGLTGVMVSAPPWI
jgi:hypothetical protein